MGMQCILQQAVFRVQFKERAQQEGVNRVLQVAALVIFSLT